MCDHIPCLEILGVIMAACDYCCEGVIKFCQMCETSKGNALHWELVGLWHLQGLFPCDYQSPSYEWIAASDKWILDQRQAHAILPLWWHS